MQKAKVAAIPDYDQYALDIEAGRIVACKWARLAAVRYLKTKRTGVKKGIKFDQAKAEFKINFVELLTQAKGDFGGQPLKLELWQRLIVADVFGFYKKNDKGVWCRLRKKVYIEIPRKNGKTTFESAIAIAMLVADGEAGPEVYFAATKKEQAKLGYDEAENMVRASEDLSEFLSIKVNNISFKDKTFGFMRPISSDRDTGSGKNIHFGGVDELHEHKTSSMLDILTTSCGTRLNYLIWMITTAGKRLDSVCYEWHKMVEEILLGIKEDDSVYGIIYTIDEGDDWMDENVWLKANPNLGVSKSWDYMRTEFKEALNRASKVNVFKQYELNIWNFGGVGWIIDEDWQACEDKQGLITDEILKDCPMWAGLDLALVSDFSVLAMAFKLPDGKVYFKYRMWIPEDNAIDLAQRDKPEILLWGEQGHITFTDGNTIHFDQIEVDIIEELSRWKCVNLSYDKTYATTMVNHIEAAGIKCAAYAQSANLMSPPIKDIERMVKDKKRLLIHDGNPVVRWMISNTKIKENQGEQVTLIRGRGVQNKIDATVAMVMARGDMMSDEMTAPAPEPKVYFISTNKRN